MDSVIEIVPTLMPLGDSGVLVRFADRLDLKANAAAVAFARNLEASPIPGVVEIVPNLVSVLVRYDPRRIGYASLCGELRLLDRARHDDAQSVRHTIAITYGGEDGPDIEAVASALGLTVPAFIDAHRAEPLDVLAVGFAPGFVYCGMHPDDLLVPRRETVRRSVPPGSILFAARQTAVAATPVPTGWAVIGRTSLINFNPAASPPTQLRAGDTIAFEAAR
ncbi:MAG: carboxyltransferase domain-containing protein [Alphaproteobacteria bacterium]